MRILMTSDISGNSNDDVRPIMNVHVNSPSLKRKKQIPKIRMSKQEKYIEKLSQPTKNYFN